MAGGFVSAFNGISGALSEAGSRVQRETARAARSLRDKFHPELVSEREEDHLHLSALRLVRALGADAHEARKALVRASFESARHNSTSK